MTKSKHSTKSFLVPSLATLSSIAAMVVANETRPPSPFYRDKHGDIKFRTREEKMVDPVLLDVKALFGDDAVKKLAHGYQHICTDCYGFGYWPGDNVPLLLTEAQEGWSSEECPVCGSDNAVYEYLLDRKEKQERDRVVEDFLFDGSHEIDKVLYEFEKGLRCAELSDTQELDSQQLQW